MTEADGFPAAVVWFGVPTAAVPHQTCWVGLPTKGALSWPVVSARSLQVCQVLCPASPASPKGQHWAEQGCDILMSAGSSWARMLHSVSNFCRSCCIFLLQIPGVFWFREGSWLGGTTGLQTRAAWAWYPLLCITPQITSLPWNCHPRRISRAQSQTLVGCNICDCSFLIAAKEFGDISSSGAHLWL